MQFIRLLSQKQTLNVPAVRKCSGPKRNKFGRDLANEDNMDTEQEAA